MREVNQQEGANDVGCVAVKWAAESREGWGHREKGCQKPSVQQKTTKLN